MLKSKHRRILLLIPTLLALGAFLFWNNQALVLTERTLYCDAVPDGFVGCRIVHLTDLHNTNFGADNRRLIELVAAQEPDLICITGDMIDARITRPEVALTAARQLSALAPVYYVPGNHEARIPEYAEFESALRDCGVQVLRNEALTLTRGDDHISLIGLEDPSFLAGIRASTGENAAVVYSLLKRLHSEGDGFTLLLSHRPELYEQYLEAGIDLTLCGHAHGGQIILPLLGSLYAPGQGFFPELVNGAYSNGPYTMMVSRGLGNSLFPFRINNRPEVVVITLQKLD